MKRLQRVQEDVIFDGTIIILYYILSEIRVM